MYFNTEAVTRRTNTIFIIIKYDYGKGYYRKYQYRSLSNEINIYTGGISHDAQSYSEKGTDKFTS